MNSTLMKQTVLFIAIFFCALTCTAQKVFFKSSQSYSQEEFGDFYTAITLNNNQIFFNAPDFRLYAYDKISGSLKWTYKLNYKSNTPCFFVENHILVNGDIQVVVLDTATGKLAKKFPFKSLLTAPFIKNDILYGTGIYEGGSLYAYDLKKDSILWARFLAHGVSIKPYYFEDKIVANAEGNNWIELAYSGALKDTSCDTKEVFFPSDLPCVKKFGALTHDGKEVSGKLEDKIRSCEENQPYVLFKNNHTIILSNGRLYVLGNKLKKKLEIQLTSLSDSIDFNDWGLQKILKADNEILWLLYSEKLIIYNYQKKSLVKIINLEDWEPHQAIFDENRLWLISRKDGLLYGLTID